MTPATDPDRVLAVILARGGSKGIPRKNVRVLAGIPLIGRAVTTLKAVLEIHRVVVSTDATEVASMALAYGAEVPFLRPPGLAADDTPSLEALEHTVRRLFADGERAALTLLFQVTSPCCGPQHLRGALACFRESDAPYLKSVTPVHEHPHWMGRIEGNRFHPITPAAERARRRQELPRLYSLNGAISIYRSERILSGRAEEGEPIPYIMDRESSLDLDDMGDWQHAEMLLQSS